MAKRYQRGNHNPYIEEEQTTQWPKDTKEVIIIRISKKNRQHNGQKKKGKQDKRRPTEHIKHTTKVVKLVSDPFVVIMNNQISLNHTTKDRVT